MEQKGIYHEPRGGITVRHEENSDTVLRCINQNIHSGKISLFRICAYYSAEQLHSLKTSKRN